MRKRIRVYGDEILRKKAHEVKKIDKDVLVLIQNMADTLKKERGLGLAATQVGTLKRIFLALDIDREKVIVAINPELADVEGKEIDTEGCLSFPDIFFSIERAKKVVLKAVNEKGKEFFMEAEGTLARCFQHEIDHLNGQLIIDYVSDAEKKFWKDKLNELQNPKK